MKHKTPTFTASQFWIAAKFGLRLYDWITSLEPPPSYPNHHLVVIINNANPNVVPVIAPPPPKPIVVFIHRSRPNH